MPERSTVERNQEEGTVESSASPPAAWHPDPDDPTQLRYWDGIEWTQHRSPAPVARPSPPATPSAPGAPGPTVAAPSPPSPLGFAASSGAAGSAGIAGSPGLAGAAPGAAGGPLLRVAGGLAALWALIVLVRLNRLIEGDRRFLGIDLLGSVRGSWWRFFEPIWPGRGTIGREIDWLADPLDRISLSPYLWLTAALGLAGFAALLVPTRTLARTLAGLAVVHVAVALLVGFDTSAFEAWVRFVGWSSVVPAGCAVAAFVAGRPSSTPTNPVGPTQF